MPENPDDRLLLKDLCRQMLSFENHFLSVYKVYLLQQFQGNEHDALLFATTRLQEVIYPDQEVMNALLSISVEADAKLQQAVAYTLQLVKERQN